MSDPLTPDQVGKYHEHKCGFTRGLRAPEEGRDGEGCGHVWGHDADNYGKTNPHICPACGRGPWYTHWKGEKFERETREKHQEIERLFQLIEEIDGLRQRQEDGTAAS